MAEQAAKLLITLSLEDGDPSELDELTSQLKSEIAELPVESIQNVSVEAAPNGTKAADWSSLGEIAVTLSPALVTFVFELIRTWVSSKPALPIKVTVKVGTKNSQLIEYDPAKTSAKDVERLVRTLQKTSRT